MEVNPDIRDIQNIVIVISKAAMHLYGSGSTRSCFLFVHCGFLDLDPFVRRLLKRIIASVVIVTGNLLRKDAGQRRRVFLTTLTPHQKKLTIAKIKEQNKGKMEVAHLQRWQRKRWKR